VISFFSKGRQKFAAISIRRRKEKEGKCPVQFFEWKLGKNHTTEESPAHPTQLDTTIQHQLVETTPANQLSQLTPPLAAGRRPLNSTLLEQTLHHWHHPRNTTAKTTH